MDHLAFPYRSASHLALLHVIAESGAWEKYGLDVDYNRRIGRTDAHSAVLSGDIQFVSGNHVSTYGKRARGDDWVYLGQTMNLVSGRKLAVRADSGINDVAGLKHKNVGTRGAHPGLNDWLFLKQHGLDVDRDDVALVDPDKVGEKMSNDTLAGENDGELWRAVLNGKVDAAFISEPATFFATAAGLKLIDIEPLPMIFFTTLSTSMKFANSHPDIVERFLKGVIEGIHFFKTQPERAIRTLRERYDGEGKLDQQQATALHKTLAAAFEPKLYPSLPALANVYQEAVRLDKDALKISPLELWDLRFVRDLDDRGFIRELYGEPAHAAH
jgi:ABC-type nitrate/sulfonate/bicarbonate transport system substrate-binding protein